MAVVIWNDEYGIGNEEIDRQHRHIIALINALEVASASGDGARTCDMVLTHLLWYLSQHFSAEEQLMSAVGYPHLERHKQEHSDCSCRLAQLISALDHGEAEVADCVPFIRDWIHGHLLGSDQDYSNWVKANPEAVALWAENMGANLCGWRAA